MFASLEKGSLAALFHNLYWPGFLIYLFFTLVVFLLRSVRYNWLLGPGKVSVPNLFLVTTVRQVFIDLLPMKLGELSYVVLLKKRFQVPVESGLSSMMAVWIFDSICVVGILVFSLAAIGQMGSSMLPEQVLPASIFLAASLFVLLWKLDRIFFKMASGINFVFSRRKSSAPQWLLTLAFKMEKIAEELAGMKKRKIYLKTFFISFAIRVLKYLSLFSVLYALIRSEGISLAQLNFFKVVIGVAGAEVTAYLPIQGLAGFGTWESAWAVMFQWLGFSPDLAILSGFGTHLATQITEYILGACCLLLLFIPLRRRIEDEK